MNKNARIYVAGHSGLVGSTLCRLLRAEGYENLITATRNEVDLRDPVAVRWFFSAHSPAYVFLAAAKVGGIVANRTRPADFILENLQIQNNVISMAAEYDVKKLLFFGSSCAYPRLAPCPIQESSLFCGALEPTNQAYATAKLAGVQMCRAYREQRGCDFVSCLPTNLYGIGDHYDPEDSHVIPGMLHRFHEAKVLGRSEVVLWGTGKPTREFLFADDLAAAALVLMERYSSPEAVNVGSGNPIMLATLAGRVAETVGYFGRIRWDSSRPDGTPRRELDNSKIFGLGWTPQTPLRSGLGAAYSDFLAQLASGYQRYEGRAVFRV